MDEFKLFIAYVVKTPDEIIFDVLHWTGILERELLALTKSDFPPERQLIINRNFQVIKSKSIIISFQELSIMLTYETTSKERYLELTPDTALYFSKCGVPIQYL